MQRSMETPLKRVRGLGSAHAGTDHFWKQRATALAGIPLTIAFLVIVLSTVGKDFATVKATLAHPLVAILMLLFVLSSVVHMPSACRSSSKIMCMKKGRRFCFSCSTRSSRLRLALPPLSPF